MVSPIKPNTPSAEELVVAEQNTTTKPEVKSAPTSKVDIADAGQKAGQVLQSFASQYGVKAGDLGSEEGRAKVATDVWVKINANLEKATRSGDAEAIRAASAAKSDFIDKLKGVSGPGWNFGLKEVMKPAAQVTPETPTPQQKSPVQGSQSVQPVAGNQAALMEEAKVLRDDTIAVRDSVIREYRNVGGGRLSPTTSARLSEQLGQILDRTDSFLKKVKDLGESADPQIKAAAAGLGAFRPKIMEVKARLDSPPPAPQ